MQPGSSFLEMEIALADCHSYRDWVAGCVKHPFPHCLRQCADTLKRIPAGEAAHNEAADHFMSE